MVVWSKVGREGWLDMLKWAFESKYKSKMILVDDENLEWEIMLNNKQLEQVSESFLGSILNENETNDNVGYSEW